MKKVLSIMFLICVLSPSISHSIDYKQHQTNLTKMNRLIEVYSEISGYYMDFFANNKEQYVNLFSRYINNNYDLARSMFLVEYMSLGCDSDSIEMSKIIYRTSSARIEAYNNLLIKFCKSIEIPESLKKYSLPRLIEAYDIIKQIKNLYSN